MSNGQGSLSLKEWVTNVENRVANIEREKADAQDLSNLRTEHAAKITTLDREVVEMKIEQAKVSWIPPLITGLVTAVLLWVLNRFTGKL